MKAPKFFVNGVTEISAGTITAVFDDVSDEEDELHVKLTEEGLIIDLINSAGEVIGTAGYMASDLVELTD